MTAHQNGRVTESMSECVDLLGVGFGPANLSLAIALQEDSPRTSAFFLEAERNPVWQGGMLLDGSNMQNHPSRDLVTLRNPRSRYSFLNYLFEEGRLIEHLNLPMEFPLRKEYAQYIQWATRQFSAQAEFGARVTEIAIVEADSVPEYVVTCSDGSYQRGRALVMGTGRTPYVPSPFSEEGFFPAFTDYYFKAPRSSKDTLDAYMRPTNYSSSDADVLHSLYVLIYEQRLDGEQRVFVHGNSEVRTAEVDDSGVWFEVEDVHTKDVVEDHADLVILATGFRDLGPHPHQERYPALLGGVIDQFQFDADGHLVVEADYRLRPHTPGTPPLFLNGLCESSHGIGDAGSFSLLSLRSATILDGLRGQGIT